MTNRALWLLLAGAAFVSAPGKMTFAQTQAAASEPSQGLEEIVVTARRVQEKLQDVPVSVTALNTTELAVRQINGVEDLANTVPSMIVTPQIGSFAVPQITIRGISTGNLNGEVDNPIGIYVDGVYIGRSTGASFDLADLQQLEVLRGPQATLFGRNTLGGALNFITQGPTGEFGGHLETTFGDYNLRRVKGTLNLPEFDGFSIRLSVLHTERDGYIKNTTPGIKTVLPQPFGTQVSTSTLGDDDTTAALLAARYTNDKLTVDYKLDYTDERGEQPNGQIIGFDNTANGGFGQLLFSLQPAFGGTGIYGPTYRDAFQSLSADDDLVVIGNSLTAQYDIADDLALKSITSYRRVDEKGGLNFNEANDLRNPYSILGGDPGDKFCIICSIAKRSQHQVSEEAQLIGHEDHFDWIAGFFYFDEHAFQNDATYILKSFHHIGPNTYTAGPLTAADYASGSLDFADNQSLAGYVHATAHVTDDVDISGGVRYSADDRAAEYWTGPYATPGQQTSGQASFSHTDFEGTVTYKLQPDVNIYARVATGYVSGGIFHLVPYKPTTNTTYEAGLKSEWLDHRVRANVTVFEQDLTDLQVLQFNPQAGSFLTNQGNNHTYGVEFEGSVIPVDGLTLNANLGYDHFGISNGVGIPQPAINLYMSAEYAAPKFQNDMYLALRLDAGYTSDYSIDAAVAPPFVNTALVAETTQKANWQVGARLSLLDIPLSAGTTGKVSVWGKNLLDTHEIAYGSSFGLYVPGTFQAPRTFGVDLAVDFGVPTESEPAAAAYVPPPVVAPAPAPRSYLVFFDFNKSDLTPQATEIVDTAAKNAGPAKVTQLTVTGHTDTVGSDAYNMRLSRRRAESVAAQLEKDGIPSSEIEIVAKGKRDLLVPTGDGVREPQNRRVQIVYSGGPTS